MNATEMISSCWWTAKCVGGWEINLRPVWSCDTSRRNQIFFFFFFGQLTHIFISCFGLFVHVLHSTCRTSRLLPGKHPQVFWILCSRDIKNNLPLVLWQAGKKRLRYPLVEWRVATRQQLCTGIVHAGTGEGHVIAAGYTRKAEIFRADLLLC